ncbi:hypothetical protein G5B38_12940 [Pseudohalocynthiibacter aestuariivivens]|uniref:Uncharacterized protein n=1 Tax=Roseovarius pelagicus TaxID=2980108 RepID=A0ABY6DCV4_9RHOB|nr:MULTISPECIES: hypothetical protein [Rhodobacterales]QIE46357.1 hypothetical protein G5B38_12940 [Pseudohalocynthiibacter aestuariivivens]UXX81665.1 hypothetical protein N7U68_11010 [Roseovarius pelagicus]
MSGKFISLILAASLAVTGMTAAPARADDKDIARALAAIAGIAIIGAAIHDNNKSKRRPAPYVSSRNNGHGYKAHRAHRGHKQAQRQHRRHKQQRRAHRRAHGYHNGYGQQRYSARPRYTH